MQYEFWNALILLDPLRQILQRTFNEMTASAKKISDVFKSLRRKIKTLPALNHFTWGGGADTIGLRRLSLGAALARAALRHYGTCGFFTGASTSS